MSPAAFQSIPLNQLSESPFNTRKTFTGIAELAASLRDKGVLQPLLVRPRAMESFGISFEIVAGHRRFRAAAMAALEVVPCMVREMTDEEALEAQLIENVQRSDVHPIEEAEGYRLLHEKYGRSVEEIIERTGKSRSWIYGRMKLLALTPKAREAFLADEISASIALLLARIPHPKLIDEALQEVLHGGRLDSEIGKAAPMSYREAASFVQNRYMLELERAPWKLDDAELLPAAGPCTTCPKRSGNAPDLFGDVRGPNVCTDTKCFALKLRAHGGQRVKAHEAAGGAVLSVTQAKRVLEPARHADETPHVKYNAPFVELGSPPPYTQGLRANTWKAVIKGTDAKVVLAQDPKTGRVVELVDRKAAESALRAKRPKVKREQRDASASSPNSGWKAKDAARVVGDAAQLAAIVEREAHIDDDVLSALVGSVLLNNVHMAGDDLEFRAFADRHGFQPPPAPTKPVKRGQNHHAKTAAAAFEYMLQLVRKGQNRPLLLELGLLNLERYGPGDVSRERVLGEFAGALKLDLDAIAKQATAAELERQKEAAAKHKAETKAIQRAALDEVKRKRAAAKAKSKPAPKAKTAAGKNGANKTRVVTAGGEESIEKLRKKLDALKTAKAVPDKPGKPGSGRNVVKERKAAKGKLKSALRQVESCRVCGCTEDRACQTADGACSWVLETPENPKGRICSACVPKSRTTLTAGRALPEEKRNGGRRRVTGQDAASGERDEDRS